MSNSHSGICWGKIVAGAAVAAGAVAVVAFFPETSATVGNAIKDGVSALFGGLGDVGSWIASKVASVAAFVVENKALSIGTAAGAGALAASTSMMHQETAPRVSAEEESFAMREDMRRMQALMMARMQAQGYEPAVALAQNGRNRG